MFGCISLLRHSSNFKISFVRWQINGVTHSSKSMSKSYVRHLIFDLITSYITYIYYYFFREILYYVYWLWWKKLWVIVGIIWFHLIININSHGSRGQRLDGVKGSISIAPIFSLNLNKKSSVLLTSASGALVKELKVEIKVKFYIEKNTFLILKSRIHNFQYNISFYNSLTDVPKALINIFQKLKIMSLECLVWIMILFLSSIE